MHRRHVLAALLAAPALARAAHGQDWPTRPVVFLVPSTPGGSLDTLARLLANALADPLGQPVVVENRAGAGGAIGADFVAKSPPDANRFLLGAIHHAILPAIARLAYDSATDLAPVTRIAVSPNALIVHPGVAARAPQDLAAWIRAQPPGAVNYATGGRGTLHHLTGALFAKSLNVEMTPVHYRGSAPAINDLIGGRTALMFETMPSAAGQVRAGTLRALAVTSPARSPAFPDLPTMAEAGFPQIQVETWYSLFGAKGTPPAVAQRLQSAVAHALATPALRDAWAQNGVAGGGEPVAEFAAFWQSELRRWSDLARQAGVDQE